MAAPPPCTSSMFVRASQVLDEEPHQHETRTLLAHIREGMVREVACVVVEFTQPRPTKGSGTRTNMLGARVLALSCGVPLCQPVHQCVSPHRPLDELASGGRIEWQHGVPDQRVLQQRSHVPAHHDTWRPSSRAHAQGALSRAALMAPLLPRQQLLLPPQHTTCRSPPQALV